MFAVEVQGLYKQFGPQTVLQDVSFQLESGKIHGWLAITVLGNPCCSSACAVFCHGSAG